MTQNVFKRIEVAFLPIGHTLDDIDQTFSCTHERLRSCNAVIFSDLHRDFKQTYKEGEVEGGKEGGGARRHGPKFEMNQQLVQILLDFVSKSAC